MEINEELVGQEFICPEGDIWYLFDIVINSDGYPRAYLRNTRNGVHVNSDEIINDGVRFDDWFTRVDKSDDYDCVYVINWTGELYAVMESALGEAAMDAHQFTYDDITDKEFIDIAREIRNGYERGMIFYGHGDFVNNFDKDTIVPREQDLRIYSRKEFEDLNK